MSKSFRTLIVAALLIFVTACGKSEVLTWQEQYDLGVRYLNEGNYEEAILSFQAAIEIEPNRVEAYIELAKVYVEQGDIQKALDILNDGFVEIQSDELADFIEELGGKWARPDAPTMPDVIGLDLRDAREKLEQLGVEVTVEHEFDDKIRVDGIIDTSVKPGGRFDGDGAVTLTVSDGPEEEFRKFIYDMAGRGLMYAFYEKGDGSYDSGGTIYDADGDGKLDWIVCIVPWCVTTIREREGMFTVHSVDISNHSLDIYKDARSGGLVFKAARASGGYAWSSYTGFENGCFTELAREYTTFGGLEGNGIETEYTINGTTVGQAAYEDYVKTLVTDEDVYSNAGIIPGSSIMEPLNDLCTYKAEISDRLLDEIETRLSELPFVTQTYLGDLDQDGSPEVAAIIGDGEEAELAGVDYSDDIGINRSWRRQECGITVRASGNGLEVHIGDAETVKDDIWRSKRLAEMEYARSNGLLLKKSGNYEGIFYKDLLVSTSDGIYAYIELEENVILTDERVRSLKVGDTIHVTDTYSVPVEELYYSEYIRPYIQLCDSGEFYLDWTGNAWLLRTYDDMPVKKPAGTATVLFAKDAAVFDDLSWGWTPGAEPMTQVSDIIALFERPSAGEAELISFTISGGKVTDAILPYRPV